MSMLIYVMTVITILAVCSYDKINFIICYVDNDKIIASDKCILY